MIRRQPLETKINHERWLISYSDFITLLFAFFVVMYSVSQVNENKYKELSEALQHSFSKPSSPEQNTEQSPNPHSGEPEETVASLDDIQQKLEQSLKGMLTEGHVRINGNEHWVDIAIDASALFLSGQDQPSAQAKSILNDVAEILSPFSNAVAVAGHTDNLPIANEQFKNNWELSAARAVAVVNILAYAGVNPNRLSAVGYGEYRPIADNINKQGREKNRRVVLRVAKDMAVLPAININEYEQSTASIPNNSEVAVPPNSSTPQNVNETVLPPTIKPIELKNGGLLFTSDPDLPRNNR